MSDARVGSGGQAQEGCALIVKSASGVVLLEVRGPRATVGRRADVSIDGEGVAEEHARLELREGAWTLHAVGGAPAGVNGVPLRRPWTLRSGDRIRLGGAHLVF